MIGNESKMGEILLKWNKFRMLKEILNYISQQIVNII